MTDNDQLRRDLESRGVQTVCHFTPLQNLDGILLHGLLPRSLHDSILGEEAKEVVYPDSDRLDGRLDTVSLSVSYPNAPLFYRQRKKLGECGWVVVRCHPSVLWSHACAFVPTNASHNAIVSGDLVSFMGPSALPMFFLRDGPHSLDIQAEVLSFDRIPPVFITALEFDERSYALWRRTRRLRAPEHVRVFKRNDYFLMEPR